MFRRRSYALHGSMDPLAVLPVRLYRPQRADIYAPYGYVGMRWSRKLIPQPWLFLCYLAWMVSLNLQLEHHNFQVPLQQEQSALDPCTGGHPRNSWNTAIVRQKQQASFSSITGIA